METDPRFTPHRALAPYYQTQEDKQAFLRTIFDESAAYYERIVGWGFFGTGNWYRRAALKRAGLETGMQVVDVASGTGTTARVAADLAGGPQYVTCVDPSAGMLRESERRLPARHVQGTADVIPLPDAAFDFLSMGFALRHVENLKSAFAEFQRVLKPGGRLLIMEITKPNGRFAAGLMRLYFRDLMPRFARLLTGSKKAAYLMEYYWETMDQMVDPERVLEALASAGLEEPRRRVIGNVFSEYTATKR
ncbi:MAG TPA: class I SAM-dependent methyltransferase [Burkholderiales bacterium]|nr:class I SAM-dependent methyltransferase [Burkholderiales bacterium]